MKMSMLVTILIHHGYIQVDENEHVGYNPHPSWLCLIMGLSRQLLLAT
jgi:hypothetical protein